MANGGRIRPIAVVYLTSIFLILILFWIVRNKSFSFPRPLRPSLSPSPSPFLSRISVSQNPSGYLVILGIPEQFVSAVDDFVQLYMVNQMHWKLRMIEPYVLGTWLAFVPPVEKNFDSLPVLSTYLNRSHMLHNLKECFHSDVELNTFQDFLIYAAREFIVLKFETDHIHCSKDEDICKCSFPMKKQEDHFNYHLQKFKEKTMAIHGANYQFTGVHSLCVRSRPEKPFSMLQAVKYVKQWMMNTSGQSSEDHFPQYTVVIPEWRAIRNQSGHHFYYDPSYTTVNFTTPCHLETLRHSLYITNAASAMLDTLAFPRPLIALHVRSENLAKEELQHHVKGFIDNCLSKLPRVVQAVQRKYNVSRDHIIFIHDGSDYGSASWWGGRRDRSRYIISKIKELGIRNVQYKPVNTTSVDVDVAAAQFIEKEILVSADVLILAGFGNFQSSVLARFRSKGKGGDKWYRVCAPEPKDDHLPGLDL